MPADLSLRCTRHCATQRSRELLCTKADSEHGNRGSAGIAQEMLLCSHSVGDFFPVGAPPRTERHNHVDPVKAVATFFSGRLPGRTMRPGVVTLTDPLFTLITATA